MGGISAQDHPNGILHLLPAPVAIESLHSHMNDRRGALPGTGGARQRIFRRHRHELHIFDRARQDRPQR